MVMIVLMIHVTTKRVVQIPLTPLTTVMMVMIAQMILVTLLVDVFTNLLTVIATTSVRLTHVNPTPGVSIPL
jgi:hypothetical protein